MNFLQDVRKRLPTAQKLPSYDDLSKSAEKMTPRLAFFRRRIRLRENSRISIPLGLVLLFPCLIVILILLLFVRHPTEAGRILMPAGAPPAIRYESSTTLTLYACADLYSTGKSAKSTTRSLLQAVKTRSLRETNHAPTPLSSSSPVTRNSKVCFSHSNRLRDTSTDGSTTHTSS
jgi:hypothetical protein